MKYEIFRGTKRNPTGREDTDWLIVPWLDACGEDRIRTSSNQLVRDYRGLMYMGRANTMRVLRCWYESGKNFSVLAQYAPVRNDMADHPDTF